MFGSAPENSNSRLIEVHTQLSVGVEVNIG